MRTSLLPALLAGFGLATLAAIPAAAGTPDGAEIRHLIDQLGSTRFAEREEASAALDAAGELALPGLRKAAEGDDAEVRRRAGELVRKIEQRVESDHLLAPMKVKLAFKDTPLPEAVAELSRQSGYAVVLQDPNRRLKDRKITLNTGEMSFWEALDRLCAKGHVAEEGMLPQPVAVAANGTAPPVPLVPGAFPPPAMAPGVRFAPNRPVVPFLGQLNLVDSGLAELPTAYVGAVSVRGRRTPGTRGDASHISLDMVVAAEPKVRCQEYFSVRIEKVVDDQGQELALAEDPLAGAMLMPYGRRPGMPYSPGFSVQHFQNRLIAGEKTAKSLREVHGMLSARVYTEPRTVLAADDVLNAVGKTFPGSDGGSSKVLEATRGAGGHLTLRIELDLPPDQGAEGFPAGVPVRVRGGGLRVAPGGGALPIVPPPVAAPAANSSLVRRVGGLSLLDDKGNYLRASGMRLTSRDVRGLLRDYTLDFDLPEGHQAAKLVYNASKAVTVDVSFTLKDVPLP